MQHEKRQGNITITRPRTNTGAEWIEIRIEDESSGLGMTEVEIDLAAFARALTGLGAQDCEYEVRSDPTKWGMVCERKDVSFPRNGIYDRNKARAYLEECVKEYEVDGWQSRIDRTLSSRIDGDVFRVGFLRDVARETTKENL